MEEQPGLAKIVDGSFIPCTSVVDAVAERHIQLQAAGARRPGRPLFPGMTAPHGGLGLAMLHPLGATHGRPVILVLGGTQQTNLIEVSVITAARPGEFVGATPEHKNIHDFLRHDGYFRTLGAPEGSSSPEPGFLGRLLSCRLAS